jgi:formylglycine-generating enzyme required for sulfatase activity
LNERGNQIEKHTSWLDAGDEDVKILKHNGIWRPVKGYEDHPVVETSWYGARAYCDWVGRRLPSEAEWEKAARGVDQRIYPWGDEIDCDKAQYANCSGSLLPVDSKPGGASSFGVLGLSGNIWEWTADWYADDYYENSPTDNPLGPDQGDTRVLKGGSWEYDWKHLRLANRRHNGPAVSMHDYGFRCVLDED